MFLFWPAELISAGQGLGNAVILDGPPKSSKEPNKPGPISPPPQKIRHDIPVLKDKPPPPCPTAQGEGNRNGGGSRASDQWSKKLCEINKESLTHPTPNFLSFILGNGSSPKCWAAQASLHCSAGGSWHRATNPAQPGASSSYATVKSKLVPCQYPTSFP